mgnify:CR=1 FL=1
MTSILEHSPMLWECCKEKVAGLQIINPNGADPTAKYEYYFAEQTHFPQAKVH